jgi:hypothetical protein
MFFLAISFKLPSFPKLSFARKLFLYGLCLFVIRIQVSEK